MKVEAGETRKAHARRLKEGWFDKYAPADKSGLDIGCGYDCLNETFQQFDQLLGNGDAQVLEDVGTYHTVYASHILEHIVSPIIAVARWFKVVKPGGHLIICVPHRHLYEAKTELPSRWNEDHKHFFLPETEEPPCTLSLKKVILDAIPDANIVELKVQDADYHSGVDWYQVEMSDGTLEKISVQDHPRGEFSIEAIIRKN